MAPQPMRPYGPYAVFPGTEFTTNAGQLGSSASVGTRPHPMAPVGPPPLNSSVMCGATVLARQAQRLEAVGASFSARAGVLWWFPCEATQLHTQRQT